MVRGWMGQGAGKPVTGLDIEPGYVTAVESVAGGIAVERAAAASLPAGVVREGEVLDVDALADALRRLFDEHKLSRHVRLGLANQRIVMRTIDLPPLRDTKELESAVRFQAQDHIPMPLDQVVLEHQSLGIVSTPEGERSRVVLVAARRDMIERLLSATRAAGLRPEGIDLSAFAMIRALHRFGAGAGRPAPGPLDSGAEPDAAATLYVSVGGVTNLAIAAGTLCVFTRVVPAGSESMAAELAERRALTLEHARMWLRHVGLTVPVEAVDGQPEIVAEARGVLVEGTRRIVDEIRNTLDFHRTQGSPTPVAGAVVTGPAVAIPGFVERLGEGIGLPVQPGIVPEARSGAFGGLEPERLAVAAGLTLSEAPR